MILYAYIGQTPFSYDKSLKNEYLSKGKTINADSLFEV